MSTANPLQPDVPHLVDLCLLPIDQIEEDPNQPRRNFDSAGLEALADNIEHTAGASKRPWVDGLLHPISVYPSPGYEPGGPGRPYRVLVGARRLRAYRLREWPEIPARLLDSPESIAHTLMVQLNENLGREATNLLEDAIAVDRAWNAWRDEKPDARLKDFAATFGRSPSWVSQHCAVARATGLARVALEEGHLRSPESYRLFALRPIEEQRGLLGRARRQATPISAAQLRELQAREEATGAPPSPPPDAAAEPPPTVPAGDPALEDTQVLPAPEDGLIPLRLAPSELRWLLILLKQRPPTLDAELVPALRRALSELAIANERRPRRRRRSA